MSEIDYNALKKRGFLRQRQEGFFIMRTRAASGNYNTEQLSALIEIAGKYGKGIIHSTTRQGIEIPFIRFEDIAGVEEKATDAGISMGTSGPRIRAITCCPGNNWCKRGLINTFELFDRIENEFNVQCGMDLPHKFKIAISGCPNTCTRAQVSDIGIHGQVDVSSDEKRIGYAVYLGGSGGRIHRVGYKIDKIFTIDEVSLLIKKVVTFYKENAKPRQRLSLLIEEIGKDAFLKGIGLQEKSDKNV